MKLVSSIPIDFLQLHLRMKIASDTSKAEKANNSITSKAEKANKSITANLSETNFLTTEQTVMDFMNATGEGVFDMEPNLRQYTSLKMLRLYSKWANAVRKQRRRLHRDEVHPFNDYKFEKVLSSLSPTCARLEVNAISLISSMKRSSNNENCFDGGANSDDDDDDGTSTELANLENTTRELQLELESQEKITIHRRDEQSVDTVSTQGSRRIPYSNNDYSITLRKADITERRRKIK